MENKELENIIETSWESRDEINDKNSWDIAKEAVEQTLNLLGNGSLRVAEKNASGEWVVNQWTKKAVLLSFRLREMELQRGGPQNSTWWDKVDSKFKDWGENEWRQKNFRAVLTPLLERQPSLRDVVVPSFVNLGAYVDAGTMVDTWATVGSCAQIGKNVHLSGGVGIGGVLEPMQASPTIIEDNCFIGARSEIVEGCIVREGAVVGMGVFIGKSTKIFNRETGETTYGEIPPYSVVVSGSIPSKGGGRTYIMCSDSQAG